MPFSDIPVRSSGTIYAEWFNDIKNALGNAGIDVSTLATRHNGDDIVVEWFNEIRTVLVDEIGSSFSDIPLRKREQFVLAGWFNYLRTRLLALDPKGENMVIWKLSGDISPLESVEDGFEFFDFNYLEEQEVYALLTVPDNYVDGVQIKMQFGSFFCNASAGNVLYRTVTTLLEDDSTVLGTYTNQHTSTNTEKTLSIANRLTAIGELDLTDSNGEINSVAVTAGDKLLVKLHRDSSAETSSATADARLIKDSIISRFTA